MQIACNTTKYLGKNESLLVKNKTQILDEYSFDKKFNLNQELITLYKQKPNTRYFFAKVDWWYHYLNNHVSKKTWLYKTMIKYAKPSSVLDTAACVKTCHNMENYFFNKGYFSSKVDYKVETKNKKSIVLYIVSLNEPTIVDSFEIISIDSNIQKIIKQYQSETNIIKGEPLNNLSFQAEKLRVSDLLYNNGYAEFNPIYFSKLNTDTIGHKARVTLNIQNPGNNQFHKKYKIGNIKIFPDYQADNINSKNNFFNYSEPSSDTLASQEVKAQFLRSKIAFSPSEIYDKSKLNKTYLDLSKLGIYRFVSFDTKVDSFDNDKINVDILLSKNKKWIFDSGLDGNFTTVRAEGSNLLGTSAYFNLKNRNLWGGAEAFSTRIQTGAEFSIFKNKGINSLDFHYANELVLPRLIDVTSGIKLIKWGLNKFKQNTSENFNSYTNFLIGLDYVSLFKLYSYTSINTQLYYQFKPNRNTNFSFNTLNFSFFIPTSTDAFDAFLEKNPLLKENFKGNRLFTSFFLSDLQYSIQKKINYRTNSNILASVDFSGLEIGLLNGAVNIFKKKNEQFSILKTNFSKYVKFEYDQRFYTKLKSNSQLVMRYDLGIALPLFDTNSIPFIKQFYVGGPQSLRGWNVREPGPGGSQPLNSDVINSNTFFSTGDIKLEGNIEYRYDIFLWLKGAFFVDIGNVWNLPREKNAPLESRFSKRFFDQLAIGTGTGLRLDMSYFVIRFDLGIKLRNAYKNELEKNWIFNNKYKVSLNHLSQQSAFHIAVNYPF